MEKERESYIDIFPLRVGNWKAACWGGLFKINNHGIKLAATANECFEKIIFDTEKKTVSVMVNNPLLPPRTPRTVDLSESPEFFDALRENIETIMTTGDGTYKTVTPNEDRTVFVPIHARQLSE